MNQAIIKTAYLQLDTALQFGKTNRVWLVSMFILILLFFTDRGQAFESLQFTLHSLVTTSPYLLLSVFVAGYAIAAGADSLIAKAFTGSPLLMILLASVIGGLSPFCSCGVIPLIAALLTMGVPLSAVMAFWLASPVIDPASFVMTAGLLGFEFAVAKTLAAIFLGVVGGYITHSFMQLGYFQSPLKEEINGSSCGTNMVSTPRNVEWRIWRHGELRAKFFSAFVEAFVFLIKWLTLAFILESLMLAYVPQTWITSSIGGDGFSSIVLATLIGVPAYFNGYAALPLVTGLVEQGMTAGAAMSFLVAGSVTSLPAAIAVFALVKRQVFVFYILLALLGSVSTGLIYQSWVG